MSWSLITAIISAVSSFFGWLKLTFIETAVTAKENLRQKNATIDQIKYGKKVRDEVSGDLSKLTPDELRDQPDKYRRD